MNFGLCTLICKTNSINGNKKNSLNINNGNNDRFNKNIIEASKLSHNDIQKNSEIYNDGVFCVPVTKCKEDINFFRKAMHNYDLNIYNRDGLSDIKDINSFINYVLQEDFTKNCFAYYICYVISENIAYPIGVIHLYESSDKKASFYFAVLNDIQGNGFGTILAKAIILAVKEWKKNSNHKFHSFIKNIISLEASVLKSDIGANQIMKKCNLKILKEEKNLYIYTINL